MTERCKHIGKDGYRCGSHAFNLYKDDINQNELCDVHYWQERALKAEDKLKGESKHERRVDQAHHRQL
jgi:hypothetical protein